LGGIADEIVYYQEKKREGLRGLERHVQRRCGCGEGLRGKKGEKLKKKKIVCGRGGPCRKFEKGE